LIRRRNTLIRRPVELRPHARRNLVRTVLLHARLIRATGALATIEQRSVLTLRFLVAFAGAAIDAQRIGALAVALLDDLPARHRAHTFRRGRDRLFCFADAANEAEGKRESQHAARIALIASRQVTNEAVTVWPTGAARVS
jgi:hypothetical protein